MTDEQSIALFLNHTHTPYSNRITEQRDDTGTAVNHHTDYIAITEQLPDDIDIVFNRTEHIETETDLYDDIKDYVEENGGAYQQHERHAWFELDGTEAAIINSVEASVEQNNHHYTINGLPIDDREYSQISEDELYEKAKDAAWTAPAHPFVPEFELPDDQLDRFFQEADETGFTAALNYSTGYSPLVNRLAQGRDEAAIEAVETVRDIGKRDDHSDRDVHHYVEEYGIDLVPEHDTHAAIPADLDGAGVIEGAMEELRDGEIPLKAILDADVLSYDGPGTEGLPWADFIRTFPSTAPLGSIGQRIGLLPGTEADYADLMDNQIDDIEVPDSETILANTYTPEDHPA